MPKGKSKKARAERRARTFSLVRIWSVTIVALLVLLLGVLELVSSGSVGCFFARFVGPRDLGVEAAEVDRAVDAALVKLGAFGVTGSVEERRAENQVWPRWERRGRVPYGVNLFECNLAITREVMRAGGRVIRADEGGPDWRGVRTLEMRIGLGDLETHALVLSESPAGDEGGPGPSGVAPRLAIVIDDLGYGSPSAIAAILDEEFPITVSVLPHCPHTEDAADAAHRAGKEVMVHLPMEPKGYPETDPGTGALMVSHNRDELAERVSSALSSVPHAVGVNNHMGSAFTSQHIPMRVVMRHLKERGLYFLDSMTTPESVGIFEARRAAVPSARNRMFIDSPIDERGRIDVGSQLAELAEIARRRGEAIGIGHPYPETLSVLKRALPEFERDGIELVFVSQLAR